MKDNAADTPALQQDRMSALEKSVLVIEAVVDHPQPISLPELTLRLGLPRQTIHRVLQQLTSLALITRIAANDRYTVGPRLSALAFGALRSRNQTAPVREILSDLVQETGETCNIGVLDDFDFIYIERIECHWSLRVHLAAGSRVRAHSTSGGKVMLAYMDPGERGKLLKAHKLEAFTSTTITTRAKLEKQLEEIRAQGYAVNDREQNVGIVGVAVPILDAQGTALASLALHGPDSRISKESAAGFVPQLQAAAKKIAATWSY
ncbi:MAG TPA: IclR family transcriptional regulator [Hyphomicrobiaceae bacterium]|nr:IclR family transcriptional regulator [Hyphomicrobiaceae bacterium]